jgi:hypothetical protein
MSLLYGDISDERRRELARAANELGGLPRVVRMEEVVVVRAKGRADEWEIAHRERL